MSSQGQSMYERASVFGPTTRALGQAYRAGLADGAAEQAERDSKARFAARRGAFSNFDTAPVPTQLYRHMRGTHSYAGAPYYHDDAW